MDDEEHAPGWDAIDAAPARIYGSHPVCTGLAAMAARPRQLLYDQLGYRFPRIKAKERIDLALLSR